MVTDAWVCSVLPVSRARQKSRPPPLSKPPNAVSLGSPTTCIAPFARVSTSADSSVSLICEHFDLVDSRFGTLLGHWRLLAFKSLRYFRQYIASVVHVHEVDSGHHLEQFTGNMVSGTDAGRRLVDLARIGLGVGNELGNRLDRHRWIRLHDKGLAMSARDRGDVADQIEIKLLVERGVDSVHRSDH